MKGMRWIAKYIRSRSNEKDKNNRYLCWKKKNAQHGTKYGLRIKKNKACGLENENFERTYF